MKPFRVYKRPDGWCLRMRANPTFTWTGFATPAEAANFARKNWPWWP